MKLKTQHGIPTAPKQPADDFLEQSDSEDDDMENEEDILARQVETKTPETNKKVTFTVPTQQPQPTKITPQVATIAINSTVPTTKTPAQPPQTTTTT
jgi:hypothetical protein